MLKQKLKIVLGVLFFLSLNGFVVSCTSQEEEDKTIFEGEFDDVGEGAESEDDELSEESEDSDIEDDLGDELDEDSEKGSTKVAKGDSDDLDFEDEFADEDSDELDEEDEFAEEDDEIAKESEIQKSKDEAFPDDGLSKEIEIAETQNPSDNTSELAPTIEPNKKSLITSNGSSVAAEEFSPIPGMPTDDLGIADPLTALGSDPPLPPVKINESVSKINEDPFYRNQVLMNAVYIARPGDTMAKISQKIYGQDRVSELVNNNSHLKGSTVDPGDKIYYNSPKRSDDKSQIKFFYEDMGFDPKIYVTKSRDNVKKIGRDLLGFEAGWKELWAINPAIQTQGRLPTGIQVKYWLGNEEKAPILSDTKTTTDDGGTTATVAKSSGETEDLEGGGDEMDPPSTGAISEVTPEANVSDPAIEESGLETVATIPEVQEPTAPNAPAEPLPEVSAKQDSGLLTLGLIAIVAVAAIGLIAIQIKNRKAQAAMPGSMEYTQV